MRRLFLPALLTIASASVQASPALSPAEVVAAAPADDWVAIDPADLLVMDLSPDASGRARRVVIQMMPAPFSSGWVANIRALAKAHWWDGLSVNRVQDNYVVQWGDPHGEDKARAKPLPHGLTAVPQSAYSVDGIDIQLAADGDARTRDSEARIREQLAAAARAPIATAERNPDIVGTQTMHAKEGWHDRDAVAPFVQFHQGWPLGVAGEGAEARFWPLHCYGMVGVGREMPPDTGSGAELYVVIGHAPRHLDRNIALVGRVIEGIEHLSSLPRGNEALGFYATPAERTPIRSIRLAKDLESDKSLPAYEYLSTERPSFARYADARANRRDAFFVHPAGGVDICNVPVPVRRAKG